MIPLVKVAELSKLSFTVIEMGVLGALGAGTGAAIGAYKAKKGKKGRGAAKGALIGGGIGTAAIPAAILGHNTRDHLSNFFKQAAPVVIDDKKKIKSTPGDSDPNSAI